MVKIRLYPNDSVIEWDVKTDHIAVGDGIGKDIVLNFFTKDIDNKNAFFTDSNGLEMQKRELSYKDFSKATPSDISGSFYPISSAIVIRDADSKRFNQMTIMTSRTQGGSSLKSGHIELMHSRRMLYDDRESSEIVLNDTDINKATYSKYYL
jgi:lysosomal alpha-mannosidase